MLLLNEILSFLLGRRYYANIINTIGTDKCEISCFIFRSRAAARKHRDTLQTNRSYRYVETIKFRSRREY
ncbi:MAG: hypothetical protein K2I18_08645 [Paramuribaculum sp.]|nr:hypothetical protein [Paramuribaculum sp.]